MRILFWRIALRHICDIKNSQLGHDLPISVNDRIIFPFGKNYAKFHENKTLTKISEFTVTINCLLKKANKYLQSDVGLFYLHML